MISITYQQMVQRIHTSSSTITNKGTHTHSPRKRTHTRSTHTHAKQHTQLIMTSALSYLLYHNIFITIIINNNNNNNECKTPSSCRRLYLLYLHPLRNPLHLYARCAQCKHVPSALYSLTNAHCEGTEWWRWT